jgi:hypothetical protein
MPAISLPAAAAASNAANMATMFLDTNRLRSLPRFEADFIE